MNRRLIVSSAKNIIVGASLDQGTQTLRLTAGVDGVDAQGDVVANSGNIDFAGATAIALKGRNVQLTSDAAASDGCYDCGV